MTKSELIALLEAHNIPLNRWGFGEAKTLDHLFAEIESGEAIVVEEGGKLLRSAEGAAVIVYYIDDDHAWKLKEDRQVFKDGRVRRRDLDTSIGEKMKSGERALDAAYRALREELGIEERLELTPKPSIVKGPRPSQSYPGLLTRYVISIFEVLLPKHLYKPDGYVEEQEDKTNYYVWVRVI